MTLATLPMLKLAVRLRLHPQVDLHPSWLPPTWPARHRHALWGADAQAVLGDWLRERMPDVGLDFGAARRRLLLLDGKSLRRAAWYCGLVAHAPLMRARGSVGAQLRRQARRIDRDAQAVVLERLPALQGFRVDSGRLDQWPAAAGRTIVNRGYRLLQAALQPEGDDWLQRLQRKLPRRAAMLPLPTLNAEQRASLEELLLMAIVPERLPQWDWLF